MEELPRIARRSLTLGVLLAALLSPAESTHLHVTRSPAGEVVVHWRETPGNDSYGSTWTYTQGQRSGSRDFGRLPPGEYEVRLYHDWPNGGFNVQERIRFRVEG